MGMNMNANKFLNYFIIIMALTCPFYFAYHHFIVGDMFLETEYVVVGKDDKIVDGKYQYTLKLQNDSLEMYKTVTADTYVHTDINSEFIESKFNKDLNMFMIVIGVIEVVILAICLAILIGAS